MKCKNNKEACSRQEMYVDQPHCWIQWKGTDVCMDIHCECGELTHVDAEFAYFVECCECHRKYFVNGHVQLIEIENIDESVDGSCIILSENPD